MRGLRLVALGALVLTACGGDGSGGEGAEGDVPAAGTTADSAARPTADSVAGTSADSVPRDGRPLRSRLLRLVNGGDEDVAVHAAAGAGWVTLDTVAAGDSAVVNVESRARRVRLRASAVGDPAIGGSAQADGVAEGEVDLTGSGTARWLVPTPPDSDSLPGADPGDDPGAEPRPGRLRAVSSR